MNWILNLLKGFGKRAALYLIEAEGAALKEKLKVEVAQIGPAAIDRNVDALQAKLIAGVEAITFLPAALKAKAHEAIQHYGDDLQAQIKGALKSQGPGGIDKAFEKATAVLVAKINAL